MARIEDRKPKEVSGGYERIFGVEPLGRLLSKVQGTVIAAGNELESMIQERVNVIPDLDKFLEGEIMPEGVFIAPKRQVKKSTTLKFPGGEPDFLIFKRRKGKQHCYVVELKDGHVFDTKKSSAEKHAVHSFVKRNAQHLQYKVQGLFCAFNQYDREAIVRGFKNKITKEEAITGPEFCELLELDYDEIVSARKSDQKQNFNYFLAELVKISKVSEALKLLLKKDNN